MQHSQDSIESQVQKLEQRAKIAEQELFSKNAEVQAAQRKLYDLNVAIQHKTANLLAEQQLTLESAAKVLQEEVDKKKQLLEKTKKQIAEADTALFTVRAAITAAEDELKSYIVRLKSTQNELMEAHKQQKQLEDTAESTKKVLNATELSISRLTTEENRLLESISSKESDLYNLEQRLIEATTAFDTAKLEREENLRQSDARLVAITTEIENKQVEQDAVRSSLAEWQSRLEAQDQNLRIREAKVEAGEGKIVRNSNLLNL